MLNKEPIVLDGRIYFNLEWSRSGRQITFSLKNLPRFRQFDCCEEGHYCVAGVVVKHLAVSTRTLTFEVRPSEAFNTLGIKVLGALIRHGFELDEDSIFILRDKLMDDGLEDYEIVNEYLQRYYE